MCSLYNQVTPQKELTAMLRSQKLTPFVHLSWFGSIRMNITPHCTEPAVSPVEGLKQKQTEDSLTINKQINHITTVLA